MADVGMNTLRRMLVQIRREDDDVSVPVPKRRSVNQIWGGILLAVLVPSAGWIYAAGGIAKEIEGTKHTVNTVKADFDELTKSLPNKYVPRNETKVFAESIQQRFKTLEKGQARLERQQSQAIDILKELRGR